MDDDKNILIGNDKWIQWVEIDPEESQLRIDKEIESTRPFLQLLELHCIPGCCGIDAFDFRVEAIKNAQKSLDNPNFVSEFEKLRDKIQSTDHKTIGCYYLNSIIDKKVLLQILDHIISNLSADAYNNK
jgi:hypothetical protein